jgi:hypothetical protein
MFQNVCVYLCLVVDHIVWNGPKLHFFSPLKFGVLMVMTVDYCRLACDAHWAAGSNVSPYLLVCS